MAYVSSSQQLAVKSGNYQLGEAGKNKFLCSSFMKLLLNLENVFGFHTFRE